MPSTEKASSSREIWSLLSSSAKRRAIGLVGLMVVGMLLETLSAGLVIPALALLTQRNLTHDYPAIQPILRTLGSPSQQRLVVLGMLALVGVYLIKAVFLAALARVQMRFAFGVQEQLSERLFAIYLRQPYAFHLQRNSAQLIRNVINEVRLFTDHGILPAMVVITESLVLLGLCSLLLFVEPVGALIVVTVLGLAGWAFHGVTRGRIRRWGESRQYHEGMRLQHLQQGLGSVKDVKLLGREDEFLKQYRVHNAHSARVGHLQSTLQQLPRLWLELLAVIGLAILVISMLAQHRALEAILPTLGLFAATAFRLIPSLNRVLGAAQSLRYGLPVVDVLARELELPSDANPASSPRTRADPFSDSVELRDIAYTYPGAEREALDGVSLSIRCGESVGFIGVSGSGKSTLVDILLGLLIPDSGEVCVDGVDIHLGLRAWQNQIGYVPQTIFLTDDSVRRNVAFGLGDDAIDNAAVWRALQAAQLEEFIASLPNGVETAVGERGIRLSGGQRQRIGIARALYHDPGVLVMDEATSSLDTASEEGVMKAVNALQGGKTLIVVAHRLSTVAYCDRLYRLHEGAIVQEATTDTIRFNPLGGGGESTQIPARTEQS